MRFVKFETPHNREIYVDITKIIAIEDGELDSIELYCYLWCGGAYNRVKGNAEEVLKRIQEHTLSEY